jgi:hypothetical protein
MDGIATERKTVIAIFSACRENCTKAENAKATLQVGQYLKKGLSKSWKAAPVKGCYKGSIEDSFKVNIEDDQDLNLVIALASMFEQESVLIVDGSRIAWLSYAKGRDVRLGEFIAVSEAEAKAQDAWTFDPESDTYFIVR